MLKLWRRDGRWMESDDAESSESRSLIFSIPPTTPTLSFIISFDKFMLEDESMFGD